MKKVKLLPVFLITISVLIIAQLAQAASVPIVSGTTASKTVTGTKMSVFNKMLEISYPKDNAMINEDGFLADEQSVHFNIYLATGGSPNNFYYTLASNIYEISVIDDAYRLMYPGQISIAYNTNISPSVANQLSVWYSPDADFDGKASWDDYNNINLGGITNTGKRTVTAPFQLSGEDVGYYAVFLAQRMFKEFTDNTDASAWSYPYVTPLWAKGIIEQLPVNRKDNYFGLSTEVNRLEFATMLVKGLGLPLSEDEPQGIFSDIDEISDEPDDLDTSGYFFDDDADADDYYSDYAADNYCIYDRGRRPVQYVETSARNGIVSGYPDKKFKPAQKLTREEAAVIIGRAANLTVSDDMEKVQKELTKLFEDGANISPWAAPTVLAAAKAGLVKGEPGSTSKKRVINPDDTLTRAEAATLTYNLLKKMKKI